MKLTTKELIQNRLATAEDAQRKKFEAFNRYDDLYASKVNNAYTMPNGSKVFVPHAWSTVETIAPKILGNTPVIKFFPREEGDVEQSEILTQLFQYWWDKTGAYKLMTDAVKTALTYGTAILRTGWRYEPSITKSRYGGEVLDVENKPYDEPEVSLVNVYDFYIDPAATCIKDAEWVIHRVYKTVAQMEAENEAIEQFRDKLAYIGEIEEADKLKPYEKLNSLKVKAKGVAERSTYEESRRDASASKYPKDKTKDEIEILEMWSIDGKVCEYAPEHDVIIRERNNPYWHQELPFVYFNDSPIPLEFWGRGEIEPIEKIQHAMNTVVNQRIDNVTATLNPMWKAKGEVDDAELAWFQGGIIHVDEFADAEPVKIPDVTSGAYTEFQALKDMSEEALGVTEYVKGVGAQDEPLGTTQIKTAQSASRITFKTALFEEQCLKELGKQILALYQQYITQEKVIRIVGSQGVMYQTLTPEDIQGEYDIVPEKRSTEPVNEDLDRQQFLQLYQLFAMDPMVNQMELKKKLFEKFGIKDSDDLLGQQMPGMGMPGMEQSVGMQQGMPQEIPQDIPPEMLQQAIM